tara:strand:- start:351 stop:1313 length:963 start_codon:yes stop_codon:yes gene_type:complete
MNLIFIHLGDKKIPYLNDSIKQAIIFNNNINIYLISKEKTFKSLGTEIKKKIIFKDTNKITLKKNHINFIKNTLLDDKWYKGFWKFTSERFFYLQNIVESHNLENIIHIENDSLIYFNIKSKMKTFQENYQVGLLLDSNIKAIPSFLYFKDLKGINKLVNLFEKKNSFITKLIGSTIGKIYFSLFKKDFYRNNDMNVLFDFYVQSKKNCILPSSTPNLIKNKQYSKNINLSINYKKFGGIFDPASFGLYLDGFDKSIFFKNTSIDIEKFISKCAIDVKKYKIYFKKYNKKKVPYIFDANKRIKLLTLHIHSKRLNKFLSK